MPTITTGNAATFRRPLNRPDPVLPVQAMKTYAIHAPLSTHWRTISCQEAGCLAQHNGFATKVDEATELGQRQAGFIRYRSGKPYRETREGGITVFTFPPGVECFVQHKTRRARPSLFVVRRGDWRGHFGTQTIHTSPDAWKDDFASHQDRLARARR